MSKNKDSITVRTQIDGEWQFVELPKHDRDARVLAIDSTTYVVEQNGTSKEIFVDSEGKYGDGNTIHGVEIKLESAREALIRERFGLLEGEKGAGNSSTRFSIKAPMPGLVRNIIVRVDEIVEKNAILLVLEAMKMENNIGASIRGVVRSIHVEIGATVNKNEVLIELETLP